jgi:hypothetical protein
MDLTQKYLASEWSLQNTFHLVVRFFYSVRLLKMFQQLTFNTYQSLDL